MKLALCWGFEESFLVLELRDYGSRLRISYASTFPK